MSELENALAQQAPPIKIEDPSRHEMPPLVIDGIPTPVEKMTQAQLRAFIPLMLKYSTGKNDDFSTQKPKSHLHKRQVSYSRKYSEPKKHLYFSLCM